MTNKLAAAFSASQFAGYVEDVNPALTAGNMFEGLFPISPMDGLDFSYIKSANGAIELTSPSAFDAEPIAQNREGFDAVKGELPLFRKKMVLSEKEKYMLNLYLNANNEEGVKRLLTQIYNDQLTLVTGSLATMEFLRSRALMNGTISMLSKGGAVVIDYKIPTANKHVLTGTDAWTDSTADIVGYIQDALDVVEDATGLRPSRMAMNRKTFRLLRDNAQIRANLLPLGIMASATVQDQAVVNDAQIMGTFKALTGISEVMIYNQKVMLDGTMYDLVEDFKVAIFPASELGKTMIGTSPAELSASMANAAGAQIAVTGEGIAINVVTKTDAPYTTETQVEFVGLPSFPMSDKVVLMTVGA